MVIDNDLSETTKPHSWVGWLKGIGWCVLILALLIVLGVFWYQGRMAGKLQEMLAELDCNDPGWRLREIEVARDNPPEEENSARVVAEAARQMPQQWPSADFSRKELLRSLSPNEMLSGEDFVLLSRELAGVRAALATVGKLADMPRGRHPIDYKRNPIATLLPHLQECRNLVHLLVYESMRRNQKRDSKNALIACRAALNVARSIGDEPIYISQLVRSTCVITICQAIERTLGQGEPSPEDLKVLQKLLEEEDAFPALLIATRGERAILHQVFAAVDRGEVSLKELAGFTRTASAPPDWLQNSFISLWRMDTREDNALFLSLMTRRLKEVQRPLHEQAALEKEFEREVRALPKNAMITRLLLPAMSKTGETFRHKHALLRSTIAALATERCRHDKKVWPDNIDQLCPQYLATVPLDPYDGKPLHYRRVKDGIVIYSVGQDGVDNGGNLNGERLTLPGVDTGFRLWDAVQRRQPPQAKPPHPFEAPTPPT